MDHSHSNTTSPDALSKFNNYFELLKLPVGFQIDDKVLASHYQAIQMQVHPDRFAGASAQQQRLALQWASQVNEAYQTLKDPGARAAYLLKLLSGSEEWQNSGHVGALFLQEQMELHEALAMLVSAEESSVKQLQYNAFVNSLEIRRQNMVDTLTNLFSDAVLVLSKEDKCGQRMDVNFKEIATTVQQYSYIVKLITEAKKQSSKI